MNSNWQTELLERKQRRTVYAEPHHFGEADGKVNAYEFAEVLSQILPGECTVIADSGTSFYVMGQAFRCKEGQRYIASGSLAAMGWTMPACTGAALAAPDRLIVGVTGDGSLMTNVHELAVWREHGLNVKLFVLDNDGYLSIRNTQDRYFAGRHIGVRPWMPRLPLLVESFDIRYVPCPGRHKLAEAITRAIKLPGPCVCVVKSQPNQKLLPQVESRRDESGRMVSARLDEMSPWTG